MARPQRSTKDAFLDTFDDFPIDVQEGVLDTMQMLHRQAKRRAQRIPAAPLAENPAAPDPKEECGA